MKKRILSLTLALTMVLSLAGCGSKEAENDTTPIGVAVQVQEVTAQDISSENTVSGQVTAGSETASTAKTARCWAIPTAIWAASRPSRDC